jgi:hypothetical protein
MPKRTIIDPPEGWKYGFPKPIPDDITNLKEWLFGEGYPTDLIELAIKYSRYWEEEIPEEE